VPGQGVVVKKVIEVTRNMQKRQKTGGFVHFLANKLPKTSFFAQKYLTRYNPETFFEEYIN
jgi:hypothetical protein